MKDLDRVAKRANYENALSRLAPAKVDHDQAVREVSMMREKLSKAQANLRIAIIDAKLACKRYSQAEEEFRVAKASWSDRDHFEWNAEKGIS